MKQKTKLIIVLGVEFIAITVVLLLIFLAGKKTYTVTFDLDDGILISGEEIQRVTQGQNAYPPEVAKDGHYLRGWSASYMKITRDITIKAIWEYETTPGIEYDVPDNKNYCEISGSYKDLHGDVYIGAYYGERLVLGIKEGAFKDRVGITAVYLLDGILSIDDEAFMGCTGLEVIEIPSTVVSIGRGAFANCENLKTLILSDTLVSIGEDAFLGCDSLEQIIIPSSVKSIGHTAFNTPGLVINLVIDEEDAPLGFANGWHTSSVTVNWGYVIPDDEESEENESEA